MSHHTITSLSELCTCWAAERQVGLCHECKRCASGSCKLPEAKHGRLVLATQGLKHFEEEHRKAQGRLARAAEDLNKEGE